MRPARLPSRWVKIRPWYYAERNAPTRAADLAAALGYEDAAAGASTRESREGPAADQAVSPPAAAVSVADWIGSRAVTITDQLNAVLADAGYPDLRLEWVPPGADAERP